MKHKQFLYKGATVHYSIIGAGAPAFLIHGFGEDGTIWNKQIEYLSSEFLIIVPDVPGSGNSDSLPGNNVGLEDYANCIKAIASEEKLNNFCIIGHSMGGYISLAYLEKYPSELNGIGLFHSTAFPDDEQKIQTRKKAIQFIESNGSTSFLKTSIPGLFYSQESSKKHIDTLIKKSDKFSKEQLIQYYEVMIKRPDRTELLKKTTVPVLLIAGKFDIAVTKDASLQQSHMPGLCHFYLLKNSGHMGMLEETEYSNQILAKFLHSCSSKQNQARN